jgi:hypothetical protein
MGFSLEIVDPSIEASTIGGQSHFDTVEKYRRLSFSQRVSSETEFKYFQTLFNTVGITKPLIISYDYDNYTDATIYGYFTRTMAGKHKDQNIYDISFDFKEAR